MGVQLPSFHAVSAGVLGFCCSSLVCELYTQIQLRFVLDKIIIVSFFHMQNENVMTNAWTIFLFYMMCFDAVTSVLVNDSTNGRWGWNDNLDLGFSAHPFVTSFIESSLYFYVYCYYPRRTPICLCIT